MPSDPKKRSKRKSSDKDNSMLTETGPAKRPRKTKIKPYVPALRSGPYAILLALSTGPETSGKGMTKRHLIELAQPHCDSSFTVPSDPSKSYTAWSSMKTLQGKDLIYVSGGAIKTYTLTDEGWDVAKRVISASEVDSATAVGLAKADKPTSRDGLISQSLPPTNEKSQARRDVPDASTYADLDHSNRSEKIPSHRRHEVSSSKLKAAQSHADADFVEILSSSPDPHLSNSPRNGDLSEPTTSINLNDIQQRTLKHFGQLDDHVSDAEGPQLKPLQPQYQQQNPGPRHELLDRPLAFDPIIISPSEYAIELLLDNREVRTKSDRDYIQSGLLTLGIKPATRSLPVGDALWCARIKDASRLTSCGEEGEEIVLDHIVERKRLDDLVGSIKDGRFTEQKFRLKRSGMESVVYLVEDFNLGSETEQHYHEHMCSAMASTMAVSGFFVKRTKNVDDTIAYLARMTRLLREQYAGKSLHVIPSNKLDSTVSLSAYRSTLADPHYVTYEAFANLSSKSDTLTLRDVFLKMLMCSRGITGEKALEIQKIWKTPSQLVDTLRHLNGRGKEELVWRELGGHVGTKKVGKAVSKRVGEVWGGA